MAEYDLSKPAPDRTHRVPIGKGTGFGGVVLILAGIVIITVLLFAVFGGTTVSDPSQPSDIAPVSTMQSPATNG